MRRHVEGATFGGLGVVAVLAALLIPTYPNYDSYYALVWGRELLDGMKPSFDAYAASTEHPLWVGWATVCDAVFGHAADRALVLTCVVAFVLLIWAVFRIGRACASTLAGVVAALCCGSSFAFALYAAKGYVDVPYLALVLWAGALEAARPRRGVAVSALLALGGLLRPEVWLLAFAYWLWCAWPVDGAGRVVRARPALVALLARRVDLLALACLAPIVWGLVDAAATGDPLHSLHATSSLAEDLGRERGIAHVPTSFVSYLADTARPPVFLAGLAGLLVAAVAWRRWPVLGSRLPPLRHAHVPLALLGAGTVAFAGSGLAGLSILPRYLTIPAVAICLLTGYVVAVFVDLEPGRLRVLWTRAAIAAAVVGVAFVIVRIPSFGRLHAELRFIRTTNADLRATLHDPRVVAARRCGPLSYPTYRLVPDTRFALHASRRAIVTRATGPRATGVAIFARGKKPIRRYGHADGVSRTTQDDPLPGFRRIAAHGMFVAYARCAR